MDDGQFDDRPTCAACGQSFEWQAAYHSQDTPGSETFNPPGHGIYRPRVYCPLCGELVIEWRIDRNKDYNRWGWVGENVVLNIGIPVPPDARLAWGQSIPLEFLPSIQEHHLDIEKIKQAPFPAEPEPAEINAVGAGAAVVLNPADETIVDTPNTQADETKTCPECGELIKLEEQICPSCSARFEVFELGYCTTCHKVVRSDPQGRCPTCQGGLLDRRIASQALAFAGAATQPPRDIPPAKLASPSSTPIDTPPAALIAAETASSAEWATKEAPAQVAKKRTGLVLVILLAVFAVIISVGLFALVTNQRRTPPIVESEATSPAPASTQAAPVQAAALLPSPVLASPVSQGVVLTPTIVPDAKMICQEAVSPRGFPTCLVTNSSTLSDPLWLAFTPFDPKGLNGYEVVVVSLADQRVIQPDSQGKVALGNYNPGARLAYRIEMNCTAPDGCPATTVYLTLLANNGKLPIFGAEGVYTLTREDKPPTASPTLTPTSTPTPTATVVLRRATPTPTRRVKPTKPAGEPPPVKPPTVAPPPPTVAPN